jgi:hypothetical protein
VVRHRDNACYDGVSEAEFREGELPAVGAQDRCGKIGKGALFGPPGSVQLRRSTLLNDRRSQDATTSTGPRSALKFDLRAFRLVRGMVFDRCRQHLLGQDRHHRYTWFLPVLCRPTRVCSRVYAGRFLFLGPPDHPRKGSETGAAGAGWAARRPGGRVKVSSRTRSPGRDAQASMWWISVTIHHNLSCIAGHAFSSPGKALWRRATRSGAEPGRHAGPRRLRRVADWRLIRSHAARGPWFMEPANFVVGCR